MVRRQTYAACDAGLCVAVSVPKRIDLRAVVNATERRGISQVFQPANRFDNPHTMRRAELRDLLVLMSGYGVFDAAYRSQMVRTCQKLNRRRSMFADGLFKSAQASEGSISLQALTSPFTALTELSNIACSSFVSLMSMIFSIPSAPITVGTPT
ncbi:hypothetical protein SAMN06295998_103216 [Primorskyibacter flagellatus]|uniref:Uncharacterized protein n=1 Tax=Primorskyibacter flagellatus TaxID=1387277 RepID=A0A1W2AR03_9RHOB|nr:hypothetical protein SAMN06295998_103216 [Primorskyibacter flagellatus]